MNTLLKELFDNIKKELPECVIREEIVYKMNRQVISYSFLSNSLVTSCGFAFREEDLLSYLEEAGLCETVGRIVSLVKEVPALDVRLITSKDYILKNVSLRVLNLEQNLAMKNDFVHLEYLDFLVVFQVRVGDGSYLLRKCLFEPLGIELGELFETAKENVGQDIVCVPLYEMVSHLLDSLDFDVDESELDGLYDIPVYVVSSGDMLFGASAIFNLERTGMEELFVFPSSVHDLIVMPYDENEDIDSLRDMVSCANSTALTSDEFLSDNVYIYRNGLLEIAG